MSYKINDTDIVLTRGDTLVIKVDIFDSEGNVYTPEETDIVRFALNKEYSRYCSGYVDHRDPLLIKDVPVTTLILRVESSDTKCLDIGNYVYDISLIKKDGTVDTFITKSNFTLTDEVG